MAKLSAPVITRLLCQWTARNCTCQRHHPIRKQFVRWHTSQTYQINKQFSTSTHYCQQSGDGILFEPSEQDDDHGPHIPVMTEEVTSLLDLAEGQTLLDMTFGAGGHSKHFLSSVPGIKIVALDRDPYAHAFAKKLAEDHPTQVTPILGCFSDLPSLLPEHNLGACSIDGVLMDLGASSMQYDQVDRGFKLSQEAPLDMRMDGQRNPRQLTAAELVNRLPEDELYAIIKNYGEEKQARGIARAITDSRDTFGHITTTTQLAKIIQTVFHEGSARHDKLGRRSHVATKTFQALRIFVNNELNELDLGLKVALRVLKPGGRCAAISFHSLEDRIVKQHFKGKTMADKVEEILGPPKRKFGHSAVISSSTSDEKWVQEKNQVYEASMGEVERNPRSRSAKLRVGQKA